MVSPGPARRGRPRSCGTPAPAAGTVAPLPRARAAHPASGGLLQPTCTAHAPRTRPPAQLNPAGAMTASRMAARPARVPALAAALLAALALVPMGE
jgi:hypothetical protein